MAVAEPSLPQLKEGVHVAAHPKAGFKLVLDSRDPRLNGIAVDILDWYDRVYHRSWKEGALGGDPLATTYANRLAVYGLPDTPQAVVVAYQGKHAIVHQSELPVT